MYKRQAGEPRYESLTDEWKSILYIDVIRSTNIFDNLVTVLNHKFSWHYGDYRVQLFIDFLSNIWVTDPALRLKLFTDYNASLIYRDFRYPPLDVIEDFIERKFNTEVEKNEAQ